MHLLRLGVNIDHVATIRNARGGEHPDPLRAAMIAFEAGADGITAHLREDRRHIKDSDITRIRKEISLPLNLEMAATSEMMEIAIKNRPNAICIVPEKRQEITTEGGLDVISSMKYLKEYIKPAKDAGIRISLFVDSDIRQIESSKEVGADIVEIHTGKYCDEQGQAKIDELSKIVSAVSYANSLGIECHAGHGITFESVSAIAAIEEVVELNIGHFIIGEAIFYGLKDVIIKMKKLMQAARS